MARKRKAKIVTATLPLETMEKLAAELAPLHGKWAGDGYKLTKRCRLWKRRDGTWTVRFVSARPDDPSLTLTTIVRGVVLR